ncbi:NAD-glutamate dehydrogenase [Marinobacterium sp. AK62]|uniref:NAD-glutamate dehydrogenase n=1 Tax=Marinobacterium alkalitolerans TaxID=1542925 RepID=A0ABS3Z7C5_9GAMM|nr:NAD-glutamate dehydrogenase [Marinobacterium alkalitolerans]MBP0047605.1 NAD-glutamate dehydrogenase [Marinobacterium alkalitolerans]
MAYSCSSTKKIVLEQLANLIREQLDEAEAQSAISFSTQSDSTPSAQDLAAIQAHVLELSRHWSTQLQEHLTRALGAETGLQRAEQYKGAFPTAYKEAFSPEQALEDIEQLEALAADSAISLRFDNHELARTGELRFKIFCPEAPLVLSDVIPVLENLGMRVLGEHPFTLVCADGRRFGISDFRVACPDVSPDMLQRSQDVVQQAFEHIWQGKAENDTFNHLIVRAGLNWREVALMRAYARYIKQLRFGFSQHFIADTLSRHLQLTEQLLAYFKARFDPQLSDEARPARVEQLSQTILAELDGVQTLDDDRILRRFFLLMQATLRTNFFQQDEQGGEKEYFSFKLAPGKVPDVPKPHPKFEIFVYSPRVEGIHLRAGRIARGGLRWSDRIEDYRTEVLGLVKAQQVKNSVIVPMGAKGGFIVKQPQEGGREAHQAEAVACYKTFIRGLLDLTDNLVEGAVQPPRGVVRHDEDDPYLVVAADKGTATFSDIANAVAGDYGFWLGDAFASGGSEGYDHKKMGITARGAWESVKRHFREQGLDTQTQPFTVAGIGDMGGDVFGNGMLLSDQIQLVAAFNHQHIFIDPTPDAARAFKERERLFRLPRSSWADYDTSLISAGGGVFSRSAKWIELSPQVRERLDISAEKLSPNELIQAILKAPVDLIWNGGIGTYIKAEAESHADVGDKSNDALRVNASELRCKVIGEGGNLGATQKGRIEFARRGGAVNTDFIDNAGGVDCSDHEVNIKILLNEQVQSGALSLERRNELLREMEPVVAELVLLNNYRQAFALTRADAVAAGSLDDQIRLIRRLETAGLLDPALEGLPDTAELKRRRGAGEGLSRPELSVLVSYAKIELKQALVGSWIAQDARFTSALYSAFPPSLLERFPQAVDQHRLRPEIVATQVANDLVNRMGISFIDKMRLATGADAADIAAAYLITCETFDIDTYWTSVEALDGQVPTGVQISLMQDLVELATRGTHWLLHYQRQALDPQRIKAHFHDPLAEVLASREALQAVIPADRWQDEYDAYCAAGVPEHLALYCASTQSRYWLMDIIEIGRQQQQPVHAVAQVYFTLGEGLKLTWLDGQIQSQRTENHWQMLAMTRFRNELDDHLRQLTLNVFTLEDEAAHTSSPETRVEAWRSTCAKPLQHWYQTLSDMQGSSALDTAALAVAMGGLKTLASLQN